LAKKAFQTFRLLVVVLQKGDKQIGRQ